jgi:hypothetical protein
MRNWLRRLPLVKHLLEMHRDLAYCQDAMRQLAGIQSQTFVQTLISSGKYLHPKNLNRSEASFFSRVGEDGIIAEIFRRIGTRSRFFCEIGAGNGLENNTAFLLLQGWQGAWVDGGEGNALSIQKQFARELSAGKLRFARSFVTAENIGAILGSLGVPSEIDLISIDVDRNTYWVWKALTHLRPSVIVCEYNANFPPHVEWVIEYVADCAWDGTTHFGASLKSLELLGREMGYSLVGCELVGADAFFVRSDLCGEHFMEPFTSEAHYEPARHFLWPMRGMMHPRGFGDD